MAAPCCASFAAPRPTRINHHCLCAFATEGNEEWAIATPQAAGVSRVDGLCIVDDKAHIVDSRGPICAGTGPDRLGGSVCEAESTDPCGCSSGACSLKSTSWSPAVIKQWSLSASDVSAQEGHGGGSDEHFRNSGVVIVGGSFFAANAVHCILSMGPSPILTASPLPRWT